MSANNLEPLSKIFNEALFRIPDYQRGYSWGKLQLEDFWKDLISIPQKHQHYTGMLSLRPLEETANDVNWFDYTAYSIIDGQQRLTTCLICLNELLNYIKELPEHTNKKDDDIFVRGKSLAYLKNKYIGLLNPKIQHFTLRFDYDADHPSSSYLRKNIFNIEDGSGIEKSLYTTNLDNAKIFFKEQLKNKKFEELENIFLNLTEKLVFNKYLVENDEDVFIAFETMNNRGKQLSNLELLKNRLIYLIVYSDKFDDTEKRKIRENINETWKEIYKQLGRGTFGLSDDDFLKAHWILYFGYSRKKGNDYINALLNKHFVINPDIVESSIHDVEIKTDVDSQEEDEDDENNEAQNKSNNDIPQYNKSLNKLPKYWYATWFPNDKSIEFLDNKERLWIDRLNKVGIGYFRPLIAAILSQHDHISLQFRISLYEAIERFIFIHFRLGTTNSSQKSTDYYKIAREIYNFNGSCEQLEERIAEITATLIETTNKYLEGDVENFIYKAKERLADDTGFYKWYPLPYLLFEYDYHLQTTSGRKEESRLDKEIFFGQKEKGKLSIEHIYPQTPVGITYWEGQFKDCSEEEKVFLTNSLGNLVPLAQSINSALQNDPFDDKKKGKEGRAGYLKGSLSEIEVAGEPDWGPEKIKRRGIRILTFMKKHWNIFALTDEQIEEITDYKKMKS